MRGPLLFSPFLLPLSSLAVSKSIQERQRSKSPRCSIPKLKPFNLAEPSTARKGQRQPRVRTLRKSIIDPRRWRDGRRQHLAGHCRLPPHASRSAGLGAVGMTMTVWATVSHCRVNVRGHRLQSCSVRKNTPREPLLTILALALFRHSLVRTAKLATCFCNTVRRATATYSMRLLTYGVKRPVWPGAMNALRITLRATRRGPPLFQILSKVHIVPPRAFSHVLRSDLYFRIRST